MKEFAAGTLHSGSKTGPVVKSRKQAIAIGLNDQGGNTLGKRLAGMVAGKPGYPPGKAKA